jgi:hypothetical protein
MSKSQNHLKHNEFDVVIDRLPNIPFYAKRTAIPSVNANKVMRPSPFNPLYETGDTVDYGELTVSFVVDEDMENYEAVFNWIHGYAFPQDGDQYDEIKKSKEGLTSDITVMVKNNHTNPHIDFTFLNCFPTSLSEVSLDTSAEASVVVECTITFAYQSFEMKRVK